MKKIIPFLFLAIIAQSVYCQVDKDTANLLKVGSDLPELTFTSLDGKTLTSDDLYGKVVLINFFATWCPPCNQELPELEADIWAKYKDNEDFALLIIDREEKPDVIQKFLDKKKFTMPFYLDEKKEIYSQFANRFIPRNYLFDKESRLVLSSMGFKKDEFQTLKKEIDRLVKDED